MARRNIRSDIITYNYTPYHVHSDLSNGVTNIDSVTKYDEYIEQAKKYGMKAFGFSEHGSIFEWVHKKNAIEAAGMKYIHAEEFYITESLEEKIRDNYHCVLIARNYDGVKELNTLSSKAFNREDNSFYYVPRISLNDLINTSDNIIVTTACIGGVLCKGNNQIKKKFLKFLIRNKQRCFLEIQHHLDINQRKYNRILNEVHKKYNIPLIAGTDTHALNSNHLKGRSIMQKSKNIYFNEEENWDLTFKSYEELCKMYEKQDAIPKHSYLEALENTNIMADMIEEFNLDYSKKYPQLYDNPEKVFKEKIVQGFKKKGISQYPNSKEYLNRIQYELKTYKANDAINFMLLEEDYKSNLREKKGIDPGPARGSVSGSEIAYLLGITDIDSIKHKLNFDRFMNPERISLADIDTDWFKDDREEVRNYLYNKEGVYCCDIITFNTIAMKGAIKDVGRALDISVAETQEISNAVELNENKKWVIDKSWRGKYPKLFEYVDIVTGTIVSVGSHPAGLVVSPFEVESWFGTFSTKFNKNPVSQINMKEIDSLNFVKLDVLGLDCVGLINKTCDLIGIPRLKPDNINFNDQAVWNSIRDDCTLIFQFESDSAGAYVKQLFSNETIKRIKKINPNFSYIDLMAMANGAIRPAGKSYRDELSNGVYRDNGHKALNDFLADTLGYLVYQEQIIEFLHSFCGYSMGEADVVRRHFSKKTGTENDIPQIKNGFIKTMKDKYQISEDKANDLIESFLEVIEDASDYLFSRNHAIPYSMLGYTVAWLRYYYPLELLTTALNIYKEDSDKSVKIKEYIKSKEFKINDIKFGFSKAEFVCDKQTNSIYQGIESIKFCNAQIAEELLNLSKNKNYTTFTELLVDINMKTSVDSRQLKILTGLNFFEDYGNNKYLLNLIKLYETIGSRKQIRKSDLDSLGIDEFIMKKYAGKETAKLYKDIDNIGVMNEMSKKISNKPMGAIEAIKFQKDYLGYIVYKNDSFPENVYVVTEFTTYKSSTRPYLILRRVCDGENIKCRIRSSKIFKESPFDEFSILTVYKFTSAYKMKKINDEWIETNEEDLILTEYEVIK